MRRADMKEGMISTVEISFGFDCSIIELVCETRKALAYIQLVVAKYPFSIL